MFADESRRSKWFAKEKRQKEKSRAADRKERMQGAGLTYMRWEGLQGGKGLLWVGHFPFRDIGFQA